MTDQPEQPRWFASGDRVLRRRDDGQSPGADHDFRIYGGSEAASRLAESITADVGEVTRLRQELAELYALFDLMWSREQEVFQRWREAGRLAPLTWPDYGKAVDMLLHDREQALQRADKAESRVDFIERQHDLVKGDWFRTCEVNNGLRQELAEAKAALEYQKNKADIAVDQWEECRDGWDYAESALTAERALRTRLVEALEDALEAGKGYAGGVCSQFCVHSMDPPDSCPIKNPVWADAADALAEARALVGRLVEQDGSDVSEAEG